MGKHSINSQQVSLWISAAVIILVVTVLWLGLSGARESNKKGQIDVLQEAIERAAVQCYALEGAYPPHVEYLKNYGVDIDESLYLVSYETYGSNIRPNITVFSAFEQ